MNIHYDYYKFFYYVAKYKSITGAAHALFQSQPNITRMMKKLEEELGCMLFVRQRQIRSYRWSNLIWALDLYRMIFCKRKDAYGGFAADELEKMILQERFA